MPRSASSKDSEGDALLAPVHRRRTVLRAGAALGVAAPLFAASGWAWLREPDDTQASLAFARNGLDVDILNVGSDTAPIPGALALGRADATSKYLARFIEPLEQGIDIFPNNILPPDIPGAGHRTGICRSFRHHRAGSQYGIKPRRLA